MKNLVLIGSLSIVLMNCGVITRTTLKGTNDDLIKTITIYNYGKFN